MSTQNGLVQRLWSYCNILRDDGLSYGDYVEQLTYLLFLKMADEQTTAAVLAAADRARRARLAVAARARRRRARGALPARADRARQGRRACSASSSARRRTGSRIRRSCGGSIVDLIDRESWIALDADVKGDAYEGLLEKNARGHEVGRRAVLHAAPADPGDRRGDAAASRRDDLRPGVRHGRLPARGARLDRRRSITLDPDQKRHLRYEALQRRGRSSTTRRGCA